MEIFNVFFPQGDMLFCGPLILTLSSGFTIFVVLFRPETMLLGYHTARSQNFKEIIRLGELQVEATFSISIHVVALQCVRPPLFVNFF